VAVASAGPYASLHLAPDKITTPAPHHSVFTDGMPFLLPNQQHQSTEVEVEVVYRISELSIYFFGHTLCLQNQIVIF